MEEKTPLLPKATLSHYRVVSKIGEGGMGKVYLAVDTKLWRAATLPGENSSNFDYAAAETRI